MKFSIGQEVYFLDNGGIKSGLIDQMTSSLCIADYLCYIKQPYVGYVVIPDNYLFSTLNELESFLAKEFEKFKPSKLTQVKDGKTYEYGRDGWTPCTTDHARVCKTDSKRYCMDEDCSCSKLVKVVGDKPKRGRKLGSKDTKPRKKNVLSNCVDKVSTILTPKRRGRKPGSKNKKGKK